MASPGAVEEDDGEGFLHPTSSITARPYLTLTSRVLLPVGVVLSSVISTDPNISPFLLVLDAKTFAEIARASIPASVHLDLHGLFIPATV